MDAAIEGATATAPTRPRIEVQGDGIPADLRLLKQWVLWRFDLDEKGRRIKVPYQLTGKYKAAVNKPNTWGPYELAGLMHVMHESAGVGFVFAKDGGMVGVDLDGCRDPETGEIADWAKPILAKFKDTYAEVSPSGTGIKIFALGSLPTQLTGKKEAFPGDHRGIEAYQRGRFFCVTGVRLEGHTDRVVDCKEGITDIWETILKLEAERKGLKKHARHSKGGPNHGNRNSTRDPAKVLDNARKYIAKMGPAIEGADGDNHTFKVALALVKGFSLDEEAAFVLLSEWNQCCQPPWDDERLRRKLAEAAKATQVGDGYLLKEPHERRRELAIAAIAPSDEARATSTTNEPEDSEEEKASLGLIADLAAIIKQDHHFAQNEGGRLFHYRDGAYRAQGEESVRRMVKRLCEVLHETQDWTPTLANCVVEFIRVDSPTLWERPPLDVINVKNGLLHIADRELLPHSPDHLSAIQLPVKFDPAATCPDIEAFVAQIFPEDAIELAWEIPAFLMRPDSSIQKAILLSGPGGNGKSTYLAMVEAFLGRQNTSNVALHKLEADKFAGSRLYGKLANICPDLPSEHLAGTSVFKAITGGDPITGEYKFRDSFDFIPFARLVFSANTPPRSQDSSQGFFDRWLVIPFMRSFRGTSEEISRTVLDARLSAPAELSGLLNKALNVLGPLVRRNGFTMPESVRQAWAEFQATTDPLAIWLDRYTVDSPSAFIPKQKLRIAFNAHLERQGKPAMTDTAFGLAFNKHRPLVETKQRTVSGKTTWCYVGIGLSGSEFDSSHGSQGSQGLPFFVPSSSQSSQNTLHRTGEESVEVLEEEENEEEVRGQQSRPNPVNPVKPVSQAECNHIDPATWQIRSGQSFCPGCNKFMGRPVAAAQDGF